MRECPYCAEAVGPDVLICPFCHEPIAGEPTADRQRRMRSTAIRQSDSRSLATKPGWICCGALCGAVIGALGPLSILTAVTWYYGDDWPSWNWGWTIAILVGAVPGLLNGMIGSAIGRRLGRWSFAPLLWAPTLVVLLGFFAYVASPKGEHLALASWILALFVWLAGRIGQRIGSFSRAGRGT